MTLEHRQPATGTVFRIKKYALHDGPGIRTTVFFKGCPLRCWWCHNPEGLKPHSEVMDPVRAESRQKQTIGKFMSVDEVMAEIEKDVVFYDESGGGVTFSGGEPLLQASFLKALSEACARRDIHTALDTSGYAAPEIFEAAVERIDLILYDLKIMDNDRHVYFTGVSNQLILENLKRMGRNGRPLRVRFPVIPGVTDDRQNIDRIARLVGSLETVQQIDLLPYHRTADGKYRRLGLPNPMQGVPPASGDQVQRIKSDFERYGFTVKIGG
jgi:pyruvate formate lyase activating enzyme